MSEHASASMSAQAAPQPAAALPALEAPETEVLPELLQSISVQRKLAVGAADDPLEKEADTVAGQVMRMPEQPFRLSGPDSYDAGIQRRTDVEEERISTSRNSPLSFAQRKHAEGAGDEAEEIRRKPAITPFIQARSNAAAAASTSLSDAIQSSRGSGSAMDGGTRSFMESRFRADFSDVKIHTDTDAAGMSNRLNAHAFTVGSDVYFGEGKYSPGSHEGKSLLAHELTHVVQQTGGGNTAIQRNIILGAEFGNHFRPVESDAANQGALLDDAERVAAGSQLAGAQHLVIYTQSGLKIFERSSRRMVQQYPLREGSPMMPSGVYSVAANGERMLLVIAPAGSDVADYNLISHYSDFPEDRQAIIRARGSGVTLMFDDYVNVSQSDLASHGYFPAVMIVRMLPSSGIGSGDGGGAAQIEGWAQTQVRNLTQRMGIGVGTGTGTGAGRGASGESRTAPDTPASFRDSAADARHPDRVVVWARGDGRQFLNVWVGGPDSRHGGVAEVIELREGETAAQLQARVEQATAQAREHLTQRAEADEASLTGGGLPYSDSTYRGGEGGQQANRASYRATMSGPEVMTRNATGSYSMSLHYDDEYPDLLGQVAAAYHGSDYVWQVVNITPLYQQVMAERGAAVQRMRDQLAGGGTPTPTGPGTAEQQMLQTGRGATTSGMTTITQSDADFRDLSRRYHNFTEDAVQAASDLNNPIGSGDGSSGSTMRAVLVNYFNLETLPLHAVMSLGGWVVRALSSVFSSDPAYQSEIPFPDQDGYYLVRCVARPRTIGDGDNAIRRMPSVSVKVVEVKEIQARTRQELESQDLNLQAGIQELLLSFRMTTDATQLTAIRQMLEVKVQEAAQSNRSFLNDEIRTRETELTRPELPDTTRTKIADEIAILRQGTAAGSGLVSEIIARQIAIKQRELEAAERSGNPYTTRDIRHQIEQLRQRLETARLREGEMQGDGQQIVRPQAIFVNEEDGQSIPVLIEIGQIGTRSPIHGYTMRLSDITGTSSDQHEQYGSTRAAAVRNIVTEYAGHFPYGRGYLTVRFPAGLDYGIREPILVRCNPRDTAQASERLDELLQVLAVAGLFVPGIGVAAAAIGAAVSAGRILSRISNHTFEWDSGTVMDILNIVSAVASGVTHLAGARLIRAQNMFAVVPESEEMAAWLTRLSRFSRIAEFVDSGVNDISYLLGTMETVNNYLDIQRQEVSGGMSHAQARRARAGLMAQAMNDQFMQHAPGILEHFRPDGSPVLHPIDETAPRPHGAGDAEPRPHGTPDEQHMPPVREGEGTPHPTGGPAPHATPHEVPTGGTPQERVQRFLSDRANVQALLRGEPSAMQRLLQAHGTWRDLIMMMQSEPHNVMYEYLVGELRVYREEIVTTLAKDFGLHLSDPNASTHATSDIDLATTGSDAGSRMTAAERQMRERFGAGWSEMLRMNFYTEAERLFQYERVQGLMTPEAFGRLQERITGLAEVLNFAKMLQHAGRDTASVQRVESLMAHLSPDQQAAVRTRAAEPPGDAAARAQDLHVAIDNLAARFEALQGQNGTALPVGATGPLPPSLPAHLREAINRAVTPDELRIAVATAISELQMEANFRTTEANISPGANRQVVRGVAVRGHEAYQSALSQLEMIEHVIHQAGGNVEVAAREYELYKYIDRFIVATQLSGQPISPAMLMYYQAAHDVYRNNRTSLQGVGRHDMSFLVAMHGQFITEAGSVLPQMRDRATAAPESWNPTPRSLEASGASVRDRAEGISPGFATPGAAGGGALGTVGSMLEARGGMTAIAHVPVVRNSALPGNETRARFVNGRLVLELGPQAGHVQLAQHLDTLRVLQRYEGTLGMIRRLFSQIGELLGMGPGYGSRGHEAQLEVTKLLGIRADLETHRMAIEAAMARAADTGTLSVLAENYAALLGEISGIEGQVQTHERDVNSTADARGHVAMASTTPTGPVLTEGSPGFGTDPSVGQTVRYRDRGGTEGTASRLTHTTLAIVTRLGQSTVRADYQSRLGPSAVNLPIGRHGFEALHAIGPGVGHESPFGIYFGPWRVNQLIQRVGIERFIGDVGEHLRSGRQVMLRVEVEKATMPVTQRDGSTIQVDFLKSITYQLYGESIRPGSKLFEMSIEVASPNDPVSEVRYDPGSVCLSHQINTFTDMSQVSAGFDPQFSASDPIDE